MRYTKPHSFDHDTDNNVVVGRPPSRGTVPLGTLLLGPKDQAHAVLVTRSRSLVGHRQPRFRTRRATFIAGFSILGASTGCRSTCRRLSLTARPRRREGIVALGLAALATLRNSRARRPEGSTSMLSGWCPAEAGRSHGVHDMDGLSTA